MNGYVIVCKRNVNCLYKSVNYVWFDFFDLFECPRSQLDYLELSNKFGTVFISSVPNLCDDREDVIRRFILLVDVFYDRKVNLILSFIDSLDSLYSGTKLSFEFLRTKSRLAEMQSDEYRFSERKFYS
jgi:cell division protein ZapE